MSSNDRMYPPTVGCRFNAVHYSMISYTASQWQRQIMNQNLNPQNTSPISSSKLGIYDVRTLVLPWWFYEMFNTKLVNSSISYWFYSPYYLERICVFETTWRMINVMISLYISWFLHNMKAPCISANYDEGLYIFHIPVPFAYTMFIISISHHHHCRLIIL